ncbi:cytoskeleton-associated protein 2-like [Sphaeramia orbicularis]|uniref:Cytoskeleton-associated protein 2-like n=1 Tax=Sphaeramia orbicularis TaxID=375764 RepID=A0A672YTX7_9TELE|nr:cytoskeleton-associated protein 2-like [Sphaeramia orbicularis]
MEAGEVVSIVSRKEIRRQKLMEYLAAKGKMKLPNLEPHNRDDGQGKNVETSALKVVMGKENKAPADRPRYEGAKVKALPLKSTQNHTSRVLGVNKGNIKGSTLTGQKDSNPVTAIGSHAQSKPNLNKVFTRTYTLASSKHPLGSSNHLRKKTNTTKQSFAVATSNTTRIDLSKSHCRSSSTSCAPTGGLTKNVNGRIIHGPMVKTKTGLVPAVTQLRNRGSDPTSNSATKAGVSTTISFAIKARSSASSVPVSKRSTTSQTKTLPASSLSNPVHRRTTVLLTARAEVKTQNKSNVKPNLGKHSQSSFRNEFSYGEKTISTSSKYPAASAKRNVSDRVPKLNQRVHPTDKSTNQKSVAGAQKIDKQCKSAAHTSSAHSVTIHTSRVINKVPLADLRGKTKTIKETENKRVGITTKTFHAQTGMKRMTATGIPHTVPRLTSSISCTNKPEDKKTPKVPIKLIPQTEGKKMTAAQEERMRKLQEWREAKGKTYKRPPMPVKPQTRHTVALPQPFWTTMKEEDEAHSLICAVDRSLADCIKLLGEGCPTDQVKEVLSRLPAVSQKFAKYWICQARLMEQQGNLDVLPMFEKAVGVVLEPVDELRSVVFEILKRKDELQAPEENAIEQQTPEKVETTPEGSNNSMMTPKPVRALICGERGNSSVVKYKITATPGGPPSQQTEPTRVNGQEVRFFTPVRRSVRIERASLQYPASLQDHDVCVASYNDLIAEDDRETSAEVSPSVINTPMYIYRENEALKDKMCVQLLCDEV